MAASVHLVAPTRLLTDTSLEGLARRLRQLGFDVAVVRGARLDELFATAASDARAVLTLSARRPRRFGDVPALVVPRGDPAAAVRVVDATFEPSGPPFSRCTTCNTALRKRHPFEAGGEVPGRVLRRVTALSSCPACGRWYWDGSHVAHVTTWLEKALGRPLSPREPGPP
ncbi:MAG: Mut7-C RNAse domain-containing protein [Candidatus Eisenbacteria bacterium]